MMPQALSRLISAWPLVGKRSLAHWRLLLSVIIGVLLASAIMAGTVIYFNSLRELALGNALSRLTTEETNILIKARRGPTTVDEYAKVTNIFNREVDARVGWALKDRERGGKSATFFLTAPGNEEAAGSDNARSYFVFLPRLLEHVTLLPGGGVPKEQALSLPGELPMLEAMIPVEAAELFGLRVGDRLSAIPFWEDRFPYATVVISGIFSKNDPTVGLWYMDRTLFEADTGPSFRTVPFYVSEKTFMEVLGASFTDLDSTYGLMLVVDTDRLNAGNASNLHGNIRFMNVRLSADLFSYRQITSLDDALREYDKRLFFSKLPMYIILIVIAVVILYYVVTLSSLLVDQQRAEIALLRSRGASSAQMLTVFVLEGATISALAVLVAPLLAATVISLLGYTSAFSDLSGGDRLSVDVSRGAYLMALLGGLLSFAALMVPAVQASRIGVTAHRQQAARPTTQPLFQRYYLDVMLLVVSVLLFRQLTERGSVVTSNLFGQLTEDRLLLAVPAVVLLAAALVMLRLFPLFIRYLGGESHALVHLVMAGTVLILTPAIAANGWLESEASAWPVQAILVLALGVAYWATHRIQSPLFVGIGVVVQGTFVALLFLVGPGLPLHQVFVPILFSLVPAQVLFYFLRGFSQRAPVGFVMGLWQMARNPTHYARLSLLLILMAGLGIFSASFGGTLERSFEERALYSTGSDIRIEGLVLNSSGPTKSVRESYAELPGVERVSPVFRGFGSDLSRLFGEHFTMFALDGEVMSQIAYARDDFSDEPLDEILSFLEHDAPPVGLVLPEDARIITIRVKPDRSHPSVFLTARMLDSNGRYFSYRLGPLDFGNWTDLRADLENIRGFGRFGPLVPTRPLTLVSVSIAESDWRSQLRAGSVSIDEISVTTRGNENIVIEGFDDVGKWSVLRVAKESVTDGLRESPSPTNGTTGAAAFIWSGGLPMMSRGIFHGPPVNPLPVLASKTFLEDTGHHIGNDLEISVVGNRVPVRLADSINYFSTLDTINERFIIADFASLSRYVNLNPSSSEFRPNEVWFSTTSDPDHRSRVLQSLESDEPFNVNKIHDREAALAASLVDPLVKAGWRALLFIAFSAVLILSALGFLVHAYVSFRSRAVQFALMRTIGFSMRQLMMLVWLEQAMVIGAGMALGTWMGGRLGETFMPFLGHDDVGTQVLPPFIMETSWGSLAVTYSAMGAVFALITFGVIWFIRRISLQRVLRLGEM